MIEALTKLLRKKAEELSFDDFNFYYVEKMILEPGNRGMAKEFLENLGLAENAEIDAIYKKLKAPNSGSLETETAPAETGHFSLFSLLLNDEWFRQNPDKVLGEPYETTDRFGKPVTKVRGTIAEVEGIDAAEVVENIHVVQENPLASEIKPTAETKAKEDDSEANILRSIELTERQSAPDFTCNEDWMCWSEVIRDYNPGISKEEIEAWVWYKTALGEPMLGGWQTYFTLVGNEGLRKDYCKKGYLCYHPLNGIDYMPAVIYFSGDVDAKLQFLRDNAALVTSTVGEEVYDRQWAGLENARPVQLSLTDPEPNNRLILLPTSSFARDYVIQALSDGTEFDESTTLVKAFEQWLRSLDADDFEGKTTAYQITEYYLGNGRFRNGTSKEEKAEVKKNTRVIGNKLFSRFLFEVISREDQKQLEYLWNRRYNSYVNVNYDKVPVCFEASSTFKNKPLFIRPAQREGIAFNSVNGTGIVAYDVGVGKTMTLILSIAQRMHEGGCKRPLIVVPNQTYKKWLAEIEGVKDKSGKVISTGLLPQYDVLGLYNLGADYIELLKDADGNIQPIRENTITVMTYEGFKRLAFNESTEQELFSTFSDILNQGKDDERDRAKQIEKIGTIIGKGLKDSIVSVEEIGIDYLAIDEAHSCKKVFTKVKGETKDNGARGPSQYALQSGDPSVMALKAFMIGYYIMQMSGRKASNVVLLTATPFTNSPLEIYSMLALVGYEELKKRGINNIKEFFDTFVNETIELKFTAKQKFEMAPVIKSFNNRQILQNLIYSFINYKTGEEANIERPDKIVLPLLNETVNGQIIPLSEDKQVSTNLQPTNEQRTLLADIKSYVRKEAELSDICNLFGDGDSDDESSGGEEVNENSLGEGDKDAARSLRALNYARQITLSPYLYACHTGAEPTAEQYIESSPKLKYVMQCIASVKKWHIDNKEDVSGQVIYMNAGIRFFPLIKEYLVTYVGYKPNEVEIISSGIAVTKKEKIKEDFLEGKVKIIIGSATIKEGIDLQNRSTVLYNCWLDWNPTDMKQLEGRIWRFGNIFDKVRIVCPLLEDSIDIFLFQKLEEKTARVNDIWYRAGRENVLPLEEINPEELKMGLLNDPGELAEFVIEEEVKKVQYEQAVVKGRIDTLTQLAQDKKDYAQSRDSLAEHVQNIRRSDKWKDYQVTDDKSMNKLIGKYLDAPENQYSNYWLQRHFDTFRRTARSIEKAQKSILDPYGIKLTDNLTPLIEKLQAEFDTFDDRIAEIKGKENKARLTAEFAEKKEKGQLKSRPLAERVKEFEKLNYLLGIKKVYKMKAEPVKKVKAPVPAHEKQKALARAKALILIAKAKKLKKVA